MERPLSITAPSVQEIVTVLRTHPLIKLREPVARAFIVGSFAKGMQTERSDVDVLLEVSKKSDETEEQMEWRYRAALQRHFMQNNIRGVADHVHPQWSGRRVDMYFTFDADAERRPKIELMSDRSVPLPVPVSRTRQNEPPSRGCNTVPVSDQTHGINRQPFLVQHLPTPGEELATLVRNRPWDETAKWIRHTCPGVLGRLSRLANIDDAYRLDRVHDAIPASRLARMGDRASPRSVWRGLPAQFEICPGDCVALAQEYAARHVHDDNEDAVEHLDQVHPEDIYWSGTDENEFFYMPAAWRRDGMRAEAHLKALSDEQIRILVDGEMHQITCFRTEIQSIREHIMTTFDPLVCGEYHGPDHWHRVGQHARAVARAEGIDPLIPHLFALVHDSQRENDGLDPLHAPRAAEFINENRDSLFSFLTDSQVSTLSHACRHHSDGMVDGDQVVRACWDGDRLDLGRVGIEPAPELLCTDYGRRADVIRHACRMNGFRLPEQEFDYERG